MRKAAGYEDPLPSKEQLLLVNGLRSFFARPVFSTDEHGADKHKMERFLHEGRCGLTEYTAQQSYKLVRSDTSVWLLLPPMLQAQCGNGVCPNSLHTPATAGLQGCK